MGGMGRNGPWPGGRIRGKSSQILKRPLFGSPVYEEDVEGLADLLGPTQVVFGSDFPHPEGLADPLSFREEISNRTTSEVRQIMRGNARALVGLS